MLKNTILIVIGVVVVLGAFFAYQVHRLTIAHSTFENYYKFRGCKTTIVKTETYGDCQLADGSTIRMVKFNDAWFLDGDLPQCALHIGSTCLFNWP